MDHIRLLSVSPSRLTVLQTQLKYSTLTLVLHPRAALNAPLPP
jgi:hypothetical protein